MGWKKVPHPKGTGENVGGVLSKDFVQDMEVGRLSSKLPEAKRALEVANATSYWTSVRKRVMDRIFLPAANPHGADHVLHQELAHRHRAQVPCTSTGWLEDRWR